MCEVIETRKRNEYPPSMRQPTSIYSKWSLENRDKKVLSNDDLQDMNQMNFIMDIVMNGL